MTTDNNESEVFDMDGNSQPEYPRLPDDEQLTMAECLGIEDDPRAEYCCDDPHHRNCIDILNEWWFDSDPSKRLHLQKAVFLHGDVQELVKKRVAGFVRTGKKVLAVFYHYRYTPIAVSEDHQWKKKVVWCSGAYPIHRYLEEIAAHPDSIIKLRNSRKGEWERYDEEVKNTPN